MRTNDGKIIKDGETSNFLLPLLLEMNGRERLRVKERDRGTLKSIARDHNVDLNIIQVTTVSQGHKILMSGSPWKALGVDFMICKYNVLQQ